MENDLQQLDAVYHVYCALFAIFKVLQIIFVRTADDYRVANFVAQALLLAFHGLRLRQM